ncbi:hypothetical protein GCM10022377_16420 [Zhihengliuella alba]|uniref:DUF2332 domain-containing protein n=1 Tax=Zhihengliuella alba TaxID=547018 RepID=A0ABP7DC18_9MICC
MFFGTDAADPGTERANTARRFTEYARVWFPAHSPLYAEWAEGVAADDGLLDLVRRLPADKQQPNLVFAAARFLGCPDESFPVLAGFLRERWDEVATELAVRRTQTNEPARCATLLPVLSRIQRETGQPLALVELGPSAGLCLLPDRYAYQYDDGAILGAENLASGAPLLECTTAGDPPLPDRLPEIASRQGVDLNPLDGSDPETARWLKCLVWPGQTERLHRLTAALGALTLHQREGERAPGGPVELHRGDLLELVEPLVRAVPSGHTAVVLHSAVISYLPPEVRERFTGLVRTLDCRWISNEGFFMDASGSVPRERAGMFTLALDGVPLAHTGQHGAELHWTPEGHWPEDGQQI